MPDIEYRTMNHKPIDPNHARYYWLGGSALGILFAFLTIRSNWDYFAQYYSGFSFWARVIPFFAVEATIIILPLFKGFGNKAQGHAAIVCELLLAALAFTHTYFVSDASINKLQAGKTKIEASADFDRAQAAADRVTANNERLQENYAKQQQLHAKQMAHWYDAARITRSEGRKAPPAPPAPEPPKLQDVPQVSQSLVENATMSVELAGQAHVSHQTLQGLLFLMIGLVTVSIGAMIWLADGSRIKAWLLSLRAEDIKTQTQGQPQILGSPVSAPPQQPYVQPVQSPVQSPAPAQPARQPTAMQNGAGSRP